jgi:hypothetical protein
MSEEARAIARQIHDPDLKLQMLLVAARYRSLAKRAEDSAPRAPDIDDTKE